MSRLRCLHGLFPISVPPPPANEHVSHPSEVLFASLAYVSHSSRRMAILSACFLLCCPRKTDSFHSVNTSAIYEGLSSHCPACSCSILTRFPIALQPPGNFSTVCKGLLCLDILGGKGTGPASPHMVPALRAHVVFPLSGDTPLAL